VGKCTESACSDAAVLVTPNSSGRRSAMSQKVRKPKDVAHAISQKLEEMKRWLPWERPKLLTACGW